jgi:hypothetical protein
MKWWSASSTEKKKILQVDTTVHILRVDYYLVWELFRHVFADILGSVNVDTSEFTWSTSKYFGSTTLQYLGSTIYDRKWEIPASRKLTSTDHAIRTHRAYLPLWGWYLSIVLLVLLKYLCCTIVFQITHCSRYLLYFFPSTRSIGRDYVAAVLFVLQSSITHQELIFLLESVCLSSGTPIESMGWQKLRIRIPVPHLVRSVSK